MREARDSRALAPRRLDNSERNPVLEARDRRAPQRLDNSVHSPAFEDRDSRVLAQQRLDNPVLEGRDRPTLAGLPSSPSSRRTGLIPMRPRADNGKWTSVAKLPACMTIAPA